MYAERLPVAVARRVQVHVWRQRSAALGQIGRPGEAPGPPAGRERQRDEHHSAAAPQLQLGQPRGRDQSASAACPAPATSGRRDPRQGEGGEFEREGRVPVQSVLDQYAAAKMFRRRGKCSGGGGSLEVISLSPSFIDMYIICASTLPPSRSFFGYSKRITKEGRFFLVSKGTRMKRSFFQRKKREINGFRGEET